jgi:hypothetical protein
LSPAPADLDTRSGRGAAAYLEDPATAKKALSTAHQLAAAGDDALLCFRPPPPETKPAFAHWRYGDSLLNKARRRRDPG